METKREKKRERKNICLESFGWKNLFEELIHNFGDVMSAQNEQEKFKFQQDVKKKDDTNININAM